MKFGSSHAVMLSLARGVAHAGEASVGLLELQTHLQTNVPDKRPAVACGSITAVVSKIINRHRISGRRLEEDKPLDAGEAQRNLSSALRDSAVRRRIDPTRQDIRDENMRLAFEAAIFDEEGYYSARDLRIQELAQRLK